MPPFAVCTVQLSDLETCDRVRRYMSSEREKTSAFLQRLGIQYSVEGMHILHNAINDVMFEALITTSRAVVSNPEDPVLSRSGLKKTGSDLS
jgi:hypothetical protein